MTEANDYIDELVASGKAKWDEDLNVNPHDRIPADIPLESPNWLSIANVTAVFADMTGSTAFSTRKMGRSRTTAKVYELFTTTLVRVFNEFEVEYMDIQGDGVLGIWSGKKCRYPALCAAVTFKTFVNRWLHNWVVEKTTKDLDINVHVGMDEYNVLVKRLGMRGDEKNKEVWAGHPVNVASALAAEAGPDQVYVSPRLYEAFQLQEIYESCECYINENTGERPSLWEEVELDRADIGFDTAHKLEACWCKVHGSDYCNTIMDSAS